MGREVRREEVASASPHMPPPPPPPPVCMLTGPCAAVIEAVTVDRWHCEFMVLLLASDVGRVAGEVSGVVSTCLDKVRQI